MQNPYTNGLTLANGYHIDAKYMTSIAVALQRWRGKEIYDYTSAMIDGAPETLPDEIYWEIADELESSDYRTGDDEISATEKILKEHELL